jgi:gas vesicle protein
MAEDMRGSCGSALILSFIMGGVVGAAVAILFAPWEGRQTRSKIRDLAEEVKDKSGHLSDEWKDKASVYIEKGKEFVEQKKSALSSAFDAGREAMKQEKEDLATPTPEG